MKQKISYQHIQNVKSLEVFHLSSGNKIVSSIHYSFLLLCRFLEIDFFLESSSFPKVYFTEKVNKRNPKYVRTLNASNICQLAFENSFETCCQSLIMANLLEASNIHLLKNERSVWHKVNQKSCVFKIVLFVNKTLKLSQFFYQSFKMNFCYVITSPNKDSSKHHMYSLDVLTVISFTLLMCESAFASKKRTNLND